MKPLAAAFALFALSGCITPSAPGRVLAPREVDYKAYSGVRLKALSHKAYMDRIAGSRKEESRAEFIEKMEAIVAKGFEDAKAHHWKDGGNGKTLDVHLELDVVRQRAPMVGGSLAYFVEYKDGGRTVGRIYLEKTVGDAGYTLPANALGWEIIEHLRFTK